MSRRVARDIEVVLFDVGGVLVHLSGIEVIVGWLGGALTEEQLWRRWLQSEAVRRFETGRVDAPTFARELAREFDLAIEPPRLLAAFEGWLIGPYPGALELIREIPQRYGRAVLSNSNALHWPRVIGEMGLGALFASEHLFVSHLTGRIKPDAEAFEHVIEVFGCVPSQVLFLDDNQLNVEAASRAGLQAVQVRGPKEARRALAERGILTSTTHSEAQSPR
jgi:putative hydrolase of the HAD superfamily